MSEKQREESSSSENQDKKVMVTPVQVLLGAIDLATTRGAFRIAELQLITQAYGILSQAPQTEENKDAENNKPKETPIPELERAIQAVIGKN